MEYLVTYDIADPKRLRKVARLMQEFGVRVQKSVFECQLPPGRMASLRQRAREILVDDEDSIRIYPMLAGCRSKVEIHGKGAVIMFPELIVASERMAVGT